MNWPSESLSITKPGIITLPFSSVTFFSHTLPLYASSHTLGVSFTTTSYPPDSLASTYTPFLPTLGSYLKERVISLSLSVSSANSLATLK